MNKLYVYNIYLLVSLLIYIINRLLIIKLLWLNQINVNRT